jgi:hypothetical protein
MRASKISAGIYLLGVAGVHIDEGLTTGGRLDR